MTELGAGWLLPAILTGVLSYAGILLFLSNMRELALDLPNHRSLHTTPVPRTGGWALILGGVVALLASPLGLNIPLVAGFTLLLGISALDDLRHVPASLRFLVQSLAMALVLVGLPQPLSWWWYPVLLVGGVWMVNLYNFMDGMDGLAGSMTVIGFATLGLVCAWRGYVDLAGVCALLVVGAGIFLCFNWPSASIFLGDAGSTTIGLAVVTVSLFGWQQGAFGLLLPIVVFASFWGDATLTLLRRMFARKRWWEAHREHLYQHSALRFGVLRTLHWQLGIMVLLSVLGLLLVNLNLA